MSFSKGNQDGKDQGAGDSPQPAVQFRSCTDCYPDNYQEPIGLLNSIQSCGKVDCLKKIWFSEAYRERRESNEGINFCFREYYTPLTLAVTAGDSSLVDYMLDELKADVNRCTDRHNGSPLMFATEGGHVNICRSLILKGANLNEVDGDKDTPLHCAVYGGKLDTVKLLVEDFDVNIDVVNKEGYTSLQYAMEEGHEEIFLFLLERGGKFAAETTEGKPLSYFDPEVLERYFETKIKLADKGNLSLDFSIFSCRDEDKSGNDSGTDGEIPLEPIKLPAKLQTAFAKNKGSQSFLEFLATADVLEPLCQHPYISAFLDIHFSSMQKYRSQMKDSMGHLAMILLLIELSVTSEGILQDNHYYMTRLGIFMYISIFSFDLLSIVGLHTTWLDRLLQGSLVRNRNRPADLGLFTRLGERLRLFNLNEWSESIMHVIGYTIALMTIAGGWIHDEAHDSRGMKTNSSVSENATSFEKCSAEGIELREWTTAWKLTLQVTMIIYSVLLSIKEVIQMKAAPEFRLYFRRNRVDIIAITFTFLIAMISLFCPECSEGVENTEKCGWINKLIVLVIILIWFQLCNDILECLPISNIDQYLNMFYYVARSYLRIIACFLPFMFFFAGCFKTMITQQPEEGKQTTEPFAKHFFGSIIKTFVMFVGEMEYGDIKFSQTDEQSKLELALGQFVFLVFVFMFVVVFMNLLNAIAIGDIQKLRNEAICFKNKRKLEQLLEQSPKIHQHYKFESINAKFVPQAKWKLFSFKKGHFGCVDIRKQGPEGWGEEQVTKKTKTDKNKKYNADEYRPFLTKSTIRAIKQCIKPDKTEAKIDKILNIVDRKFDPSNPSRKSRKSRR